MATWRRQMAVAFTAIGAIAAVAASVGTLTGCGLCFIPSGCGGSGGECTVHEHIESLQVAPATPCLTMTASGVDSCSADYSVEVTNSCSTDLDIGGQTIAAGTQGAISVHDGADVSSGKRLCTSSATFAACSEQGSFAGSAVTISWDVWFD